MAETEGMSWSEIEKIATKYANRVCSAAAGKIRDDLFKEAKSAILAFYQSYNPNYYHRHYKNFENNSFRKYYNNKHNSVFYGGVELTPQNLDDVYQDKKEEVFDTVFAGFHGPAGMFYTPKTFSLIPPRMIPSPRQLLLDKQKKILKQKGSYIAYGKKVAGRENSLFAK